MLRSLVRSEILRVEVKLVGGAKKLAGEQLRETHVVDLRLDGVVEGLVDLLDLRVVAEDGSDLGAVQQAALSLQRVQKGRFVDVVERGEIADVGQLGGQELAIHRQSTIDLAALAHRCMASVSRGFANGEVEGSSADSRSWSCTTRCDSSLTRSFFSA